jgi:phage-related protein
MKWQINFYSEKVKNDTHLFPKKILAKVLLIFDMVEEFGPNLGKPHTDSLGDGLFEVRAKGEEGIGRSLFCYMRGKQIVILHSFIKKTQKTPKKDLDIALTRKKEIDNDNSR